MNKFNNIIFIGGIHGVGKSTICQHICRELNIEYLLASDLLKWQEINKNPKDKEVINIRSTQNLLITGLLKKIQEGKYYLLDGHYCLLNIYSEIINVPMETIKQINPISLNIIIGDISEIKKRLEKRDNKLYRYELLERLQNEELNYANELSNILGITLNIVTQNNYSKLLIILRKIIPLQ